MTSNPRQITGSRSTRRQSTARRALTVLELLVVLAITAVLLGLILPAVQGIRESARRLTCSNHLRQLGIALHSYHDVYHGLPPGWQPESTRLTAYGWGASLLPFIDQGGLVRAIARDLPLNSAENALACRQTLPLLLCPSDAAPRGFSLFADKGGLLLAARVGELPLAALPSANYLGVFGTTDPDMVAGTTGDGAFIEGESRRVSEFYRGLTNALWLGERTARRLPSTWIGFVVSGEDAPSRVVGEAFQGPNRAAADECEFDSRHPGCANFLWGDGGVRPIADSIDSALYRRLASRRSAF